MLWGLFKKVAVADLVAPVVGTVYAAPSQYGGPILVLATLFFAVQIYCDFSGYSDIAIGAAHLLGFDLMTNFSQPYFARSISEFWRRWHISLSTWFRDYVYSPLGGNRVATGQRYANLLLVFAVSGLWHGAAWTFVIWGALHGVYLVLSQVLAPARGAVATALGLARVPRLVALTQTVWVFLLVLIGWVFFRAQTFGDAVHVLTHAHVLGGFRTDDLFALGLPRFEMLLAFVMIAVVMVVDWLLLRRPPRLQALWARRPVRWACLAGCFYGVVFFGVFAKVQFIYFQF
jgi:D-alanyl-lipoteichoic acid acyltransferase DltB (MBOAT superfamily)